MIAKTRTCSIDGLSGRLVTVEVDIAPPAERPVFNIVGLPEKAIQEARERVRAAITNSGMAFPEKRITVSLAPAGIRKSGTYYDLPVAVGILIGSGQLRGMPEEAMLLGELSLDGSLRSTPGILPMVGLARKRGLKTVFVPEDNQREASLISGIEIVPLKSLTQLLAHLKGTAPVPAVAPLDLRAERAAAPVGGVDMADIKGQENVKNALKIAAAGGHNVLMTGPPGTGKTLLARALNGILPPMSEREVLESTAIYSVAGLLEPERPFMLERAFRDPHYTISEVALVGGGNPPKPGEITLSNRGVLFLDELPEFGRRTLEALRQPLEDKSVVIARATASVKWPANFMLVGAMNPCPCGFHQPDERAARGERECTCTDTQIERYKQRISGPLLDRIDIFMQVPRQDYEKIRGKSTGSSSEEIRKEVSAARERQKERFAGTELESNSDMGPREIEQYCRTDEKAGEVLKLAMNRLRMSARGLHRVLKLARTIADMEGQEGISQAHVTGALNYRLLNEGDYAAGV